MFLSVIIPTRNRAKYLSGALESITKQTYPFDLFEVIVVDNGSTDNTKKISDLYATRLNNLRYYYDETPGLHVGRHIGLKNAKAEILVYADDDIEAFPTWLEAVADGFQDSEVVLVGGKILPKFESEPPDWILKMWEKEKNDNRILGYISIIDLGEEKKYINPLHVFGCNFSIRKTVLLEAGGFHPDSMPQELIKYRGDGESHVSRFVCEKGYKAFFHPKASVHHVVPSDRLTEGYFYQRAYNQGISDSYTFVRNKIKDRSMKKHLRLLLKRIKSFLMNYARIGARNDYQLYEAYRAGYQFHMKEISCNNKLYAWVMRDDYFNDDIKDVK